MEAPAPVSLASVAVADSHLPCSGSLSPPWLALAVQAWAAVKTPVRAPVGRGRSPCGHGPGVLSLGGAYRDTLPADSHPASVFVGPGSPRL